MTAEEIVGSGVGLCRFALEMHLRLDRVASAFAAVAGRAGGNQIVPFVPAAFVARDDVINGEVLSLSPAVLAGVIIAPKNFALGKFDSRAWAFDHVLEADDRRRGVGESSRADMSAPIDHEFGFARDQKTNGSLGAAYMERFVIGVEH